MMWQRMMTKATIVMMMIMTTSWRMNSSIINHKIFNKILYYFRDANTLTRKHSTNRNMLSSLFVVDAYMIQTSTTKTTLSPQMHSRLLSKKSTFMSMITTSTPTTKTTIPIKDTTENTIADDDVDIMTLPTNENNIELLKIRHSSAHVMAMAVQTLFPAAQVTIGPWIENGFYYDFYFTDNYKLTDQDLKNIKKEMDFIISQNMPITREEVSRDVAKQRIEKLNEPFKLELLDSIKTEPITIYHIGDVNPETMSETTTSENKPASDLEGDEENSKKNKNKKNHKTSWWDLCAGPHVESTGRLPKKSIELTSVAGSYWRGDENREQLQRIYAIAFENVDQLKYYKHLQQEALKRDHRILGKKLNLFSIQDQNAGLIFWHPAGSMIRSKIEEFWKQQHRLAGYDIVYTPHIANLQLWKTSGHFDFYKNDMFEPISVNEGGSKDEQQQQQQQQSDDDRNVQLYQLKPMNCPFHCLMYKNELRSYRDLPFRWAELGTVYRYERSGTLHGLMRVRGFTQDDAHIFCLPEQLENEIIQVLDLTEKILSRFGFTKYDIMLSTRPEQSVGTDDIWNDATNALRGALHKKQWPYTIDEGGGAFYGPKIDVKIRDAIGRLWQCSTIQCDFNLPERFELEYVSSESKRERPIMVHRAIFGSLERFFGILIENCAGNFPLWLAPTQLKILPVTDSVVSYCHEISDMASREYQIRSDVDRGNERLAKQIRIAEQQRIPLIGVVGVKEMEAKTITIRSRQYGDLGTFPIKDLFQEIQKCSNNADELTTKMATVPNDQK